MRTLTATQEKLAAKIRKSMSEATKGKGPVILIDDADWPGWSDAELMELFSVELVMTTDGEQIVSKETRG